MIGKIFVTLALLACASVQLVNSLKCHSCSDLYSCMKPTVVQCDAATANYTRDILNRHYYYVQQMNSKDYSCFLGRYREKNVTALEIRGCIMSGAVNCTSHLIDETLTQDKCEMCKKDKCNSAGLLSGSVVTAILIFVSIKFFVN